MDENEFKEGDVVQLKSGGPKMTVTEVGKNALTEKATAWVQWFTDKGEEKSGAYTLVSLKKLE